MSEERRDLVLQDYVEGRVTAEQAADLLGPGMAVVDVVLSASERFGRLPDPRGPFEQGEFQRGLSLLGLPTNPATAG